MENTLTYTRNGDYLIPNLKLDKQPEKPLGKYGRMRRAYLKENRPLLYNQFLLNGTLYPHLLEIEETAKPEVGADDEPASGERPGLRTRSRARWRGYST